MRVFCDIELFCLFSGVPLQPANKMAVTGPCFLYDVSKNSADIRKSSYFSSSGALFAQLALGDSGIESLIAIAIAFRLLRIFLLVGAVNGNLNFISAYTTHRNTIVLVYGRYFFVENPLTRNGTKRDVEKSKVVCFLANYFLLTKAGQDKKLEWKFYLARS